MNKAFTENAWDDYLYWIKSDKKMTKKINRLLKEIERSPFSGIGKPEPLKYDLAGFWSRKIDGEHRLIYEVRENRVYILACRYHYDR